MRVPQTLNHLAIIMDGNRRWARLRGLDNVQGHHSGATRLVEITRTAAERKVNWLTLFAFSSENWRRPKPEVAGLLTLLSNFISSRAQELLDDNVRLRIVGRRDRFSKKLQNLINDIEERSSQNTGLNLTVALDYGGHQDIVAASKMIAQEVAAGVLSADQVDDDLVKSRLSTRVLPPVDFLIRTGGEMRVSNFLLWDISYSELYFTDTYWPDFTIVELNHAFDEFDRRDRRFGGSSERQDHLRVVKSDLA